MAQVMSDNYLSATFMSDQTVATDENYHYLLELQEEEDARIASELQYQERAKCRKLNDRLLTAFESNIYHNYENDIEEESEEEESEEDSEENNNYLRQKKIVYDKYQLEEDKEISSNISAYSKEGINSNVKLPLHHKMHSNQRKGKVIDKTNILLTQKSKPKRTKKDLDSEEGLELGFICDWYGNRRGRLYCWRKGVHYSCLVLKKSPRKFAVFPCRGNVVYFRPRKYQTGGVVDVVSVWDFREEINFLKFQEKIINFVADPIILSNDLFLYILSYLSLDDFVMARLVSVSWSTAISLPRLYLRVRENNNITLKCDKELDSIVIKSDD